MYFYRVFFVWFAERKTEGSDGTVSKVFFKKHYKKIIIISCDVILVPLLIFCRLLSGAMLETERTCFMTLLGGKCISCGGTHFVRDFLSGHFIDAFFDNQFFFFCAVFMAVSFVFLNLFMLFDLKFAKRVLRYMYSIPTLIIFCVGLVAFLVIRNLLLMDEIRQTVAGLLENGNSTL